MNPQDWLPAFDDCLTHRLDTCTLCGQRFALGMLDIDIGPWWAVAVAVCRHCQQVDWEARLTVVLAVRYDPERSTRKEDG